MARAAFITLYGEMVALFSSWFPSPLRLPRDFARVRVLREVRKPKELCCQFACIWRSQAPYHVFLVIFLVICGSQRLFLLVRHLHAKGIRIFDGDVMIAFRIRTTLHASVNILHEFPHFPYEVPVYMVSRSAVPSATILPPPSATAALCHHYQ